MSNFLKRVPDALVRLLVVFLGIIIVVVVVRSILPRELKDSKLYVAATVEREMAKPVSYAGSEICGTCHDQAAVKKSGYHRNLSCETCHGTGQAHVDNAIDVKPSIPRQREFCVRCHLYNPSRPTGFPQINPAAHNPLKQCVTCHNPHDPKPPTVPRECEACHTEIARTKALSPHVQLECTTCHVVAAGHKVTPRQVRATLPGEREFCGKCHGKDSPVKGTPKVDLNEHGDKYVCWQCHYPHMPEVK